MIGEIASLAAALVWASASLLLKPLSTRFHPVALQGLRCLAAAVFFTLILLFTGKFAALSHIPSTRALGLIFGTFIGIGIGESLLVTAYRHIDVSQAYPISMSGYPLVTSLLALLFLREHITWGTLIGAVLVVGGVYFVAFPKSGRLLPSLPSAREKRGLILVLLTIVSWSIATLIIKVSLGDMDIMLANLIRMSGTAFLLLPVTLHYWRGLPSRESKPAILALSTLTGLLGFGVGGFLLLVGIRYAGVARTTILSSTSPLFLVPLAVLFLKEKATVKIVLGIVLSISGIWLVVS